MHWQERETKWNRPSRTMIESDLLEDVNLNGIVAVGMFGSSCIDEIKIELGLTISHRQIGELL